MARISGFAGVIYLGVTTAAPVTKQAEWALDIEKQVVESDPAFEDTWGDSWGGVKRFSLSFSGAYDDASDVAYAAAIVVATSAHKFYVYPDSASSSKYWYGSGVVKDFNITTPSAGNVTVKGSLRGSGALAKGA